MTENPNHRCGKCRWARWMQHTPVDMWQQIYGYCEHPVATMMPCPEKPEVHLHSGVHCGCWELSTVEAPSREVLSG